MLRGDPGVGKTGTAILAVKAIAEQRDVVAAVCRAVGADVEPDIRGTGTPDGTCVSCRP